MLRKLSSTGYSILVPQQTSHIFTPRQGSFSTGINILTSVQKTLRHNSTGRSRPWPISSPTSLPVQRDSIRPSAQRPTLIPLSRQRKRVKMKLITKSQRSRNSSRFRANILNFPAAIWILLFAISLASAAHLYSFQSPSPSNFQSLLNQHQRLEDAENSIRIFYLEPGSPGQTIRATLKVAPLANRPKFDALSYSWGDPVDGMERILVNGMAMDITKSLHEALENIRSVEETVALWVDQICINQSNLEEKSSQIPLMTTIYGRARTVRLWMGNHLAPRWVTEAKGTDWTRDWALQRAEEYFPSTMYWLYLLTEEEYWKRTWIIQEVAMAGEIQIHFGRDLSIPWHVFIYLVEWRQKVVSGADHRRILRLASLRGDMYQDRDTYGLSELLATFDDSFASEPRDKIYAFAGMANECRNGCIEVNYSKPLLEVYQDALTTLSHSADDPVDAQTSLIHDASVIRSRLRQKTQKVPRRLRPPNKIEDPNSYYYWICGDERADHCSSEADPSGNISFNAIVADMAVDSVGWLWSFFSPRPTRYTTIELPADPESLEEWHPVHFDKDKDSFPVRGLIAGEVLHIGPSLPSFLGNVETSRKWTGEVDMYPHNWDRKRVRGVKERFMNVISVTSSSLLQRVGSFEDQTSAHENTQKPRLFLGSPLLVGLLPSDAKVDDHIIQFWGSNSALVVRNLPDGRFHFVGRALIVEDGSPGWRIPSNKDSFLEDSRSVITLDLSAKEITMLSLDNLKSL